jgi:hypothetical protein
VAGKSSSLAAPGKAMTYKAVHRYFSGQIEKTFPTVSWTRED